MPWVKRGLVYAPNGQYEWNQTHAQVPVVDIVDEEVWRIYYASRDARGKSHTSYIEVEAGNPKHILYEHDAPILSLGSMGTFDDSGIVPSWIVTAGRCKYLYYIGWTLKVTVPYHNSIGLAVSNDGGKTFRKYGEGPLFDSTLLEPLFTASSCVLVEDGVWKNWYLSCTKWEVISGKPEPFYHIKYAESPDGIHWERKGIVAIDYKSKDEGGLARPSILKEHRRYKAWYCYRGAENYRTDITKTYRIGYAESADGIHWTRMDDAAGIDVSDDGWDSQMIAYPHVVQCRDTKYMFYNGNGFGATGFGYATYESD